MHPNETRYEAYRNRDNSPLWQLPLWLTIFLFFIVCLIYWRALLRLFWKTYTRVRWGRHVARNARLRNDSTSSIDNMELGHITTSDGLLAQPPRAIVREHGVAGVHETDEDYRPFRPFPVRANVNGEGDANGAGQDMRDVRGQDPFSDHYAISPQEDGCIR